MFCFNNFDERPGDVLPNKSPERDKGTDRPATAEDVAAAKGVLESDAKKMDKTLAAEHARLARLRGGIPASPETGNSSVEGKEQGKENVKNGEKPQEPQESQIQPEVQKFLASKGITDIPKTKIGGKMEADLMAEFIGKNPGVDAKEFNKVMAAKLNTLSPEELSALTPEEYNALMQEATKEIDDKKRNADKGGIQDPSSWEKNTDGTPNNFSYSTQGNAGSSERPSYLSSGESGTFDAPEISNKELEEKVRNLAKEIGAQEAALLAVVAVESGGKMNATRFEPHHANKGRDEATSFGAFQIMGFNAKSLGYTSATEMKEKFGDPNTGADEQVKAFGKFLQNNNLVDPIAEGKNPPDFRTFARGYNGPQYERMNYHNKMEAAYNKYKSQ